MSTRCTSCAFIVRHVHSLYAMYIHCVSCAFIVRYVHSLCVMCIHYTLCPFIIRHVDSLYVMCIHCTCSWEGIEDHDTMGRMVCETSCPYMVCICLRMYWSVCVFVNVIVNAIMFCIYAQILTLHARVHCTRRMSSCMHVYAYIIQMYMYLCIHKMHIHMY